MGVCGECLGVLVTIRGLTGWKKDKYELKFNSIRPVKCYERTNPRMELAEGALKDTDGCEYMHTCAGLMAAGLCLPPS